MAAVAEMATRDPTVNPLNNADDESIRDSVDLKDAPAKGVKLDVGNVVRMNKSGVLYATSGKNNTMVKIKSANRDGTFNVIHTSSGFDDDESPSDLPGETEALEEQNVEGISSLVRRADTSHMLTDLVALLLPIAYRRKTSFHR